jgi:hypothetical protein
MAEPWNAAWEEAEATAPPQVTVYNTIELQHPAFLSGSPLAEVPIRCVTGVHDATNFGIEDGAVFNGGEMAAFQAIPFFAERPEFAEGRTPECDITIDNIAREVSGYLEAAVQVKADLVAIFRQYRSDDVTEPCYGPIEFVIRKVTVRGTSVTGKARLDDLANKRFPSTVYSVDEFPGLMP